MLVVERGVDSKRLESLDASKAAVVMPSVVQAFGAGARIRIRHSTCGQKAGASDLSALRFSLLRRLLQALGDAGPFWPPACIGYKVAADPSSACDWSLASSSARS